MAFAQRAISLSVNTEGECQSGSRVHRAVMGPERERAACHRRAILTVIDWGVSMLVLLPAAPEKSSFWRPSAAFAVRRGDAEIGRIDLSGTPKRDGDGRIRLGERTFDCRIHVTGRPRLAHVPSRWAMYEGDAALHAAVWESGRTFLVEGPDALRLRRRGLGAVVAIERGSDTAGIGEIRRVRGPPGAETRGASDRARNEHRTSGDSRGL